MSRLPKRPSTYRNRFAPPNRRKFKPLASLLDAQPQGLARIPDHRLLWDRFVGSDKLKKIRISPRCYRLLNTASVPPENLKDFYRTYNLPEDPFFPLFLKVKTEWLEERARWREERRKAIMEIMQKLPDHRKRALRLLAEYERKHHFAGDNPLWDTRLYPKTLKRAREYARFGESEWYGAWRNHLIDLSRKYRGIPPLEDDEGNPTYASRLLSSLVLRCRRVDRREITENFRSLSKEFHPDRGGDAECFQRVKDARDTLLS